MPRASAASEARELASTSRAQRTAERTTILTLLFSAQLGLEIQVEGEEHDSVDDAKAAMELYKFDREAWEGMLALKTKNQRKKKALTHG